MKIIFAFVDGLGLGSDDPEHNPLLDPRFPNLRNLLADAIPLDACLGVAGLPQSATGQATLLTGINAPKLMGRHIEGFPPPSLKKMIQHENLFSKLRKIGKRCTFANSYWINDPHRIPPRRQSVTTVMTLTALGSVRGKKELLAGKAVNHDITRWTMHTRGYDGELISPEQAADHLCGIGEENDFTLFEYFLTDRAGHSRNPEMAFKTLETLERFLPKVASFAQQPNHLFLLCSDHGNIEDLSTFTHTKNPVPLVALGTHAERFRHLESLDDVVPAILEVL
ncbi:MAG: peptidase [Verrucomicrobia bacterium]|nr:peptidase [Verrucomicrobiota bacterium]